MSLAEHIRLRTPLVWNRTDEPERVIDFITTYADRDVYRIDAFKGLVRYVDGKWKICIVEIFDPIAGGMVEKPTWDVPVAMNYVIEQGGIFVLTNAHVLAEKLLDLFSGLYMKYREAYFADDLDEIPMQLVMLSCNDEIPPEIARHAANIGFDLPNTEELAEIIGHFEQSASQTVLAEDVNLARLTRSGLGLTEAEFVQGCLLSLRESKQIEANFIDTFKRDKIKQGGILEIRRPSIGLDGIGGLDNAKELIESIQWSWNNEEQAREFGVTPIGRVLFLGVPGSGKSLICEATAKTMGFDLAKFGVSSMMSKWIGQSEANMRMAFAQVNAMKPIVLWMDELGRDLSGSGSQNDAGTTDRVHGEFLTGLQELDTQVLLMGAANRVDGLPPEMLRADRFDKIMFVGFPTVTELMDIFRIHIGESAKEFDLEQLATAAYTFTGAEVKSLVHEARFKIGTSQKRHIKTDDLLNLIPTQKNRVYLKHKSQVIGMYQSATTELEWASSEQLQDAQMIISGKAGSTAPKSHSFQAF